MAKGVSVTLYDVSGSPIASETDIAVMWFDSDLPPDLGAIKGQSAIATTTSGGVLSLDLDNVTGLNVGDWGFLVCYKLDGSDHEDSPTFASRMQVASMSGTTPLGPVIDWVRNPDWPAQVAPVGGVQQITGLVAVFDHSANFLAFSVAGAYTVDWGDGGGTENVATGVTAEHNYTYSSVGGTIVGASDAVAVTFTDSGDVVNRTAHGYLNGQPVVFDTVVTTTGISADTTYYVVNRAANTFQVASTLGGSALTLTTDGSGTVFIPKYKVAVVTITPQVSNNITSFSTDKKHSQSGLGAYANAWLSLSINGASLSTLVVAGSASGAGARFMLQEVYLGENVITNFTNMFLTCRSLQSLPVCDTSSGTNFTTMFSNCTSLQSVPLLDLSSGTTMLAMFNNCTALRSVPAFDTSSCTIFTNMFGSCFSLEAPPLFDTSGGTSLASMFSGARTVRHVPLFDTSSCTDFTTMFFNCHSLEAVPLFDTSAGALFSSMFNTCYALKNVPLFDTAGATDFSNMFNNCYALESVPLLDLSSAMGINSMFSGCSQLQILPAFNTGAATNVSLMLSSCGSLSRARFEGTAISISYAACKLSATELDNIFSGLATVTSKTITITGNYGAGSCTTSIATGKGWTVTN